MNKKKKAAARKHHRKVKKLKAKIKARRVQAGKAKATVQ
jgi:hypothetical protein